MKLLPFTRKSKTFYTKVDDDVYKWAMNYKWYGCWNVSNKKIYVRRNITRNWKGYTISLSHCVMGSPLYKKMIDHRNRDTLNNLRFNLRIVNRTQNNANSIKRKNTKSKYKGVTFRKDTKKWSAGIRKNNISTRLGCYVNEIEAAHAYDKAARIYFGEYARTNF